MFENLNNDQKKGVLIELLNKSSKKNQFHIEKNISELYDPFELNEIQTSYLAGSFYNAVDDSRCHCYHEFLLKNLDIDRLQESLNILIKNHSALRIKVQPDFRQIIQPYNEYKIIFEDISSQSTLEIQEYIDKVRMMYSHKVYQTADFPLFHIRVTKIFDNQAIMHVSIDSLILDGWSAQIFFSQWYLLYTRLSMSTLDLESIIAQFANISFRDYIVSYRKYRQTITYLKSLQYWKNKIKLSYPGPWGNFTNAFNYLGIIDKKTYLRKRLKFSLNHTQYTKLRIRAKQFNISISALLLALFSEFLAQFSNHNQFSLILTISNRPQWDKDLQKIIGAFTTLSVFNYDLTQHNSFEDRSKAVQLQLLQDLENITASPLAAAEKLRDNNDIVEFSPVVFTSHLRQSNSDVTESWLDHLSYCVSQTPGVYLEHQIYDKKDTLFFIFDIIDDAIIPGFFASLLKDYENFLLWAIDSSLLSTYLFDEYYKDKLKNYCMNLQFEKNIDLTILQKNYLTLQINSPQEPRVVFQEFEFYFEGDVLQLIKQNCQRLLQENILLRGYFFNNSMCYLDQIPDCEIKFHDIYTKNLQSEKNNEYINEIRSRLSKKVFDIMCPPLFSIEISRVEKTKFILHIAIDLLIADGMSILLFYKELLGKSKQPKVAQKPIDNKTVPLRYLIPYMSELQTLATNYYHYQNIQELFSDKDTNNIIAINDTPNYYVRYYKQCNSSMSLKDISQNLGVSLDSLLIAILMDSLLLEFRNFDEPLGVVLCNRDMTFGIINTDIADYSMTTFLKWPNKLLKFSEHVKGIDIKLKKATVNGPLNIIQLFNYADLNSLQKFIVPSPNIAVTSCLSNINYQLDKDVVYGYGISITPKIDFDCFMFFKENNICFHFDVNISTMPKLMIERCLNYFDKQLQLLSDNSQQFLGESLIERSIILNKNFSKNILEFNQTQYQYNTSICLHTLFEKQVIRKKDQIGLICGSKSWSYSELNKLSDCLARYLILNRQSRTEHIGLYLNRNHYLIIAVMAILKAGKSFVPIDIGNPDSRIKQIIQSAKIQLVFCSSEYISHFADNDISVIALEELMDIELTKNLPAFLEIKSQPKDDAYVIFTSGSTGKPKGVTVTHQPVINLIEWVAREFSFGNHNEYVYSTSPFSFDLSIFDIFGTLCYGGILHLATQDECADGRLLAHALQNLPITFWNSTPAMLQQIIPFLTTTNLSLRWFFLSGDWIPLELPHTLKQYFENATVVALGGATEATVWSNFYKIEKIDSSWKSIPYGRPIQNAKYYVLDDRMIPCDFEHIGELYIAGDCLARGYTMNLQLSKQKFLPDPFLKNNHRMYKTGDLVKLHYNGIIELIGRVDTQVKLRGFRIELGEVEYALRNNGVKNAVALILGNDDYSKRLVAFVQSDLAVNLSDLKQKLFYLLPKYMIPDEIILVKDFPLTRNGKIDRKQLLNNFINTNSSLKLESITKNSKENIFDKLSLPYLQQVLANIIGNSSIEFKIDTNIGSQGFTSLHYVLLAAHLESDLNLKISPAIFFQFNTIEKIFEYFSSKTVNIKNLLTADIANSSNSIVKNIKYSEDIAVIGLWLRFPGAANHEEFWRNLLLGYNAITEIPLDRWDWKEYFGNPKDIGNYTDAIHGAFVNDIDIFAASFFHISPREANLMDPRQRLMLEGAWGVIEDAGYNPRELYGAAVGVFIGATGDEYERAVISKLPASDAFALTGVSPTILANRISYFFDWSGPSEVIDTACSSSLVAIHRAVQSMRNKECDFAIVGGTNLLLDQNPHISLSKLGMLSSDGKCKAFANNANGYVRGEGFAWVFLKFTESAVMNKDSIYAIIKATGVNHGGKSNSLTAPNPVRQAELLYNVYKKTNVDIRQIGFIEAHGTGTSLGDPIEFNGLTNAFKRLNSDNEFVHQFCALGSVKGNIGHLEAAAGIAGFIKLVLSIKHQKIPPTLHIKEINPNIILTSTPFFLPTETIDWIAPVIDGQVLPRIGGVSSFGFGGVYSHVVLSEYVEQEPQPSTIYNDLSIFTLTGSNETELESYINQLLIYLENHEISKESFEYILQLGRHHFCYRKLVICTTLEELKSALRAIRTKQPSSYIFDMQNIELLSNTALSKNIQMDLIKWLQGDTWKQIKFLDKVKRINIPISVLKKDKYWPKKPNEVNLPRFSVLQQKISLTTNELLWLIEHKIADKIILPGMVIIDWALEHLHSQLIDRNVILSVQDIFWQSPIYLDLHGMEIFINLTSKEENKYLVELSLLDMHSKISFTINIGFSNTMILNQSLDLSNYQNNSIHMYTQQECYDKFISIGVELGKPFRTIKKAFFLENSALFQIKLDELIPHSQKRSIVMDAALQASSLFYLLEYGNSKIPIVPFAIDILKIMQSINFINGYIEIKIIHQKNIKLPKYDAFIYDNNCNLLIYMQGIVGRSLLKPQSILHRPPVQYYQYQEKLFLQLGDKKNYDSNDMYKFLYVNISTDVANYYNSFVLTSRQDNFSKMSNLGIYFKDLLLQGLNSIVIYSEYSGKDHALQILEYEFSKIHKIFSYLSKVVVKSKLFIMLSFPITPSIHKLLMSSFEGYMLSLMKENHLLIIKILGLNGVSIKKILSKTQQLSQILLQNSYSGIAFTVDINYQLKFFDLVKISAVSLNSQSTKFTNDIYIIVGGSRGIGLQLAKFLAKTHNSTVVIIARNKPVNESFDFYAANVNVFDELKDVMEQIIAKYKTIAGVFYCAGIINDSLAILKTADKALEVIFPKVIGAINIYQIVSKLNNLKFLVYFSSLVSCTGNLGQVDYAYANKFLDLYAEHLNKNEKNNFRIVAISWPVWQDGSMKLSEKNLENYIKTSGMVPIDNLLGFNILEDLIFNYQYPHVCIK